MTGKVFFLGDHLTKAIILYNKQGFCIFFLHITDKGGEEETLDTSKQLLLLSSNQI